MTERPIIFNTELIPKILDGSKTQTRRVIKPQPEYREYGQGFFWKKGRMVYGLPSQDNIDDRLLGIWQACPYGQVGDRLWVRETYSAQKFGGLWTFGSEAEAYVEYKADGGWRYILVRGDDKEHFKEKLRWTSGRFMYQWASRITLEITNIRVERLQEITEEDADAEGCSARGEPFDLIKSFNSSPSAKGHFEKLWNSLNPKYSWEANPWVWVIGFKNCPK